MRHSLTAKALQELLHLMNVFLPLDALLPKSVHELKQFFTKLFPDQQPSMQMYCSNCQRLLTSENSFCSCGVECSQFINVPIGPQLKARLESQLIV